MLPKTSNILYASDMGKASRPAFLRAVSEAVQHNAHITFLHVMEPMNRSTETMIESYLSEEVLESLRGKGQAALRDEMENRIENAIREELADITLPHGKPGQRLEAGRPSEAILRVAREINADLIVMGTRTHSSLSKLLVGSTAQKVLQASEIPVLVVPLS